MKLRIPFPEKYSIKRIMPKTLFARSLLILIVPVLLIQVISTYIFFDRHWNKMTTRLAFSVAGEIAMIADLLDENPAEDNVFNVSRYAAQYLDFLITFDAGKTLAEEQGRYSLPVWDSMVAERLASEIKVTVARPFIVDIDAQEKWIQLAIQLDNGVLNISLPQRRMFSSSSYIFLMWMITVSTVLLIIAILFMRNQIRPIRRLAIAAERFGKGRDVQKFKVEGATEVRQAGQAFLDMSERIQRQISQRTAMLAGVSHDLRTPLTRLKLQLEMLGQSDDISAMKGDVADMERMIGGYLDFVRGEGEEQAEVVSLNELLEKVMVSARRQGRDLTLEVGEEIAMTLRPMAMERCITNLVSNACKYADHVWIGARRLQTGVEITVDDNGPGIPPDQYEDVFRPFYRVDTSRNMATGGVGLGLPIAMDIVHSHGGEIHLEKSAHGGLRAVITLPL